MRQGTIFFSVIQILLISSISISLGQGNTVVKDFNNDRSFDFLVRDMPWLDLDNWDYVLTDGKTGKRWGYASQLFYVGAESFIVPGKLRNELAEDWTPVIKVMEDSMVHFNTVPDPSLEWILKARSLEPSPETEEIFDRIVLFDKKWYEGIPFIPGNYTYLLGSDDLPDTEDPDPFERQLWYYRSHNHKEGPQSLIREDINVGGRGLHKTKHALIEIGEKGYSWVFISGVPQTGGPSKLRWPSITKVTSQDGLVFLQQQIVVGEYAFWIGDLEAGTWTRIVNKDFSDWNDFLLTENSLVILDRERKREFTFPLTGIKEKINKASRK